MDLAYLSFSSHNDQPIKLNHSLQDLNQCYDQAVCCDYLIDYQTFQTAQAMDSEIFSKIEFWWKRNWQVSLDYYLSSPALKSIQEQFEQTRPLTQNPVDIVLSQESVIDQISVTQALLDRKTHRKFQEVPLSQKLFSTLMKELKGEIFTEIWNYYVIVFNVEDIPAGIYHYCPTAHGLHLVKPGLFRKDAVKILCGMAASLTASFLVVFSIDLQEAMRKFSYSRALREIYIDSGRLAQKILIKGMQHHVGGLPSPAMQDSQMCSLLKIDASEFIPIYTVAMGIISENFPNPKINP